MSHTFHHHSLRSSCRTLASTLLIVLGLVGVAAAPALASPGSGQICSDCHQAAAAAQPVVTMTSAPDANPSAYSVHQTVGSWAAFDLSNDFKRLAGGTGSDGAFTAPLGHFVRVCASNGYATGTWTQAYVVTPRPPNHGVNAPGTAQVVAPGGNLTISFVADTGYHLTDVKVDGVSDSGAVLAKAYTFTNVQADHGIAPTFKADFNTITPTAGPNGTVSPASPQTVAAGADFTFTAIPDPGYVVDTAKVDNVAVTLAADNTYTFSKVEDKHSFDVTFKPAVVKCTAAVALSGLKAGVLRLGKSVTVRCSVKPAHGAKATLVIQRRTGARWASVKTVSRTLGVTSGACSYSYKPSKAGVYRVKVSVAKAAAYTAATAAIRTFKVK